MKSLLLSLSFKHLRIFFFNIYIHKLESLEELTIKEKIYMKKSRNYIKNI